MGSRMTEIKAAGDVEVIFLWIYRILALKIDHRWRHCKIIPRSYKKRHLAEFDLTSTA